MKFIALALLGAYVATAAATTPTATANVAKEKDFCFVGGLGFGYTTTKMIKACDDKAAPDNGCYCGRGSLQNNVFVNALLVKKGEFCFVAPMVGTHKKKGIASAKSVKACASQDGSTKNAEADGCYCGSDALLVKNGDFCFKATLVGTQAGKGIASAKSVKACASNDGTNKNTEADGCYCSVDALLVKNTEFCYGKVADGVPGAKSAKKVTGCAKRDGSAANTEADGCYCGVKINSITGTVDAPVYTMSYIVAKEKDFCVMDGNGVGYITTKMIKACDDKAAPDNGCYCGDSSIQNKVFVSSLLVKKGEFCFVAPTVGTHKKKGIASAKSVKACASQDGSTKNAEADGCYCGSDALLVKNGDFCFKATLVGTQAGKGIASAKSVKACASNDGTNKNTEADGCYCSVDALLVKNTEFCYGKVADGVPGAKSAKKVTGCAQRDGSAANTEADGCYCGVKINSITGTVDAPVYTMSYIVAKEKDFCVMDGNGVGYITTKMIKACDDKAAPDNGCYCGDSSIQNKVFVSSLLVKKGEFCFVAPTVGTHKKKGIASAKSVKACASQDGSTKNAEADGCYCGSDALLVKNGDFCFKATLVVPQAGKGIASAKSVKACESQGGSTANAKADGCYCGLDALLVKKGDFCFIATLVGTQGGKGIASAKSVEACASEDGSTANAKADGCYCGNDALLVKKGDFCFKATLVGTQQGKGIASAKSVEACASQDGSTANAKADGCYCGDKALLVKDKEFCYTGIMTTKKVTVCANVDGSTANTEANGCYCGLKVLASTVSSASTTTVGIFSALCLAVVALRQ